ncbi:MAG TPA: hypothetical protein VGE74_25995 [Gemmata sp.]
MPTTLTHPEPIYSQHAIDRMNERRLNDEQVALVHEYGREVFARGAVYHFVGRKEVEAFAACVDLTAVEGIHVLESHSGTVLTVYRNRGFRPSRYWKSNSRAARLKKARRRGRRF